MTRSQTVSSSDRSRFVWVLIGSLALGCLFFLRQPLVTYHGGVFLDAEQYHTMAGFVADREPIRGHKPFVYRVASPWLAGTFWPDHVVEAFRWSNLFWGCLALAVHAAIFWTVFRRAWVVAVLCVLFVVNLNSPFRMGAFYPLMTDPPMLFFSGSILLLDVRHRVWAMRDVVLASVLAAVGVLFREVVLLAPLAVFLGSLFASGDWRDRQERRQIGARLVPWIAGLLALAMTRVLAHPVGDYTYFGQVLEVLGEHARAPLTYLLAPIVSYGPILVFLLVLGGGAAWRTLRQTPSLLVYGVGVLGLALIGGYHGVRFVFWGAAPCLVAIGAALLATRDDYERRWVWLLVPLVVLQVLAMNPLGSIPDVPSLEAVDLPSRYWLFPYGDDAHYNHIWTHAMRAELRWRVFLQYGAVAMVFFVLSYVVRPRWKV